MDRDKAREILTAGGTLRYSAWHWMAGWMGCGSDYNCCEDSFTDVEDTLDSIENYLSWSPTGGKNWSEVEQDD